MHAPLGEQCSVVLWQLVHKLGVIREDAAFKPRADCDFVVDGDEELVGAGVNMRE